MTDIEVKDEKEFVVFTIAGDIEQDDSQHLSQMLDNYLAEDQKHFFFYLAVSPFLDSAALTMLVTKAIDIKKMGGDIIFVALSAEARETFSMTRLEKYFQFFNTEEDAKAFIAHKAIYG